MLKNIISNRILLFAILLNSFFGMNLKQSEAQCPTGFSSTIRTITISGCQYTVEFCYKCDPTQNKQEIYIKGFTKVDPNCSNGLNNRDVLIQLNGWLQIANNIKTICLNILPCEEGVLEVTIYEPVCWKYIKQGSELWLRSDTGCGDAFCFQVFEFCYDSVLDEYRKTSTLGPNLAGTPSCFQLHDSGFEANIYYQFLNNPNFTSSVCFYFINNLCDYNP
jgi:hypothetical protein